jgi:hypothetical protein
MISDDQSRIYNSLRASTIALLGYNNVDPLSAAQEIRISRAISLRLIVDASQAKQLRGEPIDVKAFVEASEDLERMVPGGNPEAPIAGHDFSGAREELARLLDKRASAVERRMAMDPNKARAEFEKKLARAIEKHKTINVPGQMHMPDIPDPGGGDAQCDSDHPSPPAAARSEHPVLIDPPPAPPPPPRRSVEEINSTPANPPPGPHEVWRDFIGPDGEIRTSPWRRW